MKLEIEHLKDAYSLGRMFVVKFGISHLAYGSTPQEAIDNFKARIKNL